MPRSSSVVAQVLESVGKGRATTRAVRQLSDEKRERLAVPGDSQGSSVDWLETRVADEGSGHGLPVCVVAGVHRAGRGAVFRLSKTLNSTSLGTVWNADTTRAPRAFFASVSAPDEMFPTTSSVLPAFIGSEQLTMTLPDR